MGWFEYIFGSSEPSHRWTSILILFKDEGSWVLDKGYVFLGDIPIDSLGYYCNFTNFSIINKKLYYFHKSSQKDDITGKAKQIDPKKVCVHIKFGQAAFEITQENIKYWNLFFSSVNNPIYKSIQNYLTEDRINMLNLYHSPKRRLKRENVKHPFFTQKEIYGQNLDQVILSSLNLEFF